MPAPTCWTIRRRRQGVVINVGEGIAEGEEIGRDEISGFEAVIGGRGNDSINSGRGSISMTGGEGEDTFEFETPDQDNRGSLVRTITDFTVGDRLLVSGYEFRDNSGHGNSNDDDSFYNRYLADEDNHRWIRFRFEKQDDRDFTVMSVAEGTPDDEYDIQLFGRHLFDVHDHTLIADTQRQGEDMKRHRCEWNWSRGREQARKKAPQGVFVSACGRASRQALRWPLAWLWYAEAGRLLQNWKAP